MKTINPEERKAIPMPEWFAFTDNLDTAHCKIKALVLAADALVEINDPSPTEGWGHDLRWLFSALEDAQASAAREVEALREKLREIAAQADA